MDSELKDMLIAAYIAGATAVHDHWVEMEGEGAGEADFNEAAWDYAAAIVNKLRGHNGS